MPYLSKYPASLANGQTIWFAVLATQAALTATGLTTGAVVGATVGAAGGFVGATGLAVAVGGLVGAAAGGDVGTAAGGLVGAAAGPLVELGAAAGAHAAARAVYPSSAMLRRNARRDACIGNLRISSCHPNYRWRF